MKRLQDRYRAAGEKIRLVSFTVDPDRDAPDVLLKYGREHGGDLSSWAFLTGTGEQMKKIIRHGFKVTLDEESEKVGRGKIPGRADFVLVDQIGRVRGRYKNNKKGIDELFRHSTRMEAQGK